MGAYTYKAKKGPDEIVESVIYASSKKEAIEKISQMGYLPVRVEEAGSPAVTDTGKPGFFFKRVRPKLVTVFTRQLSILLRSGVPILNALTILVDQSDSMYLKAVLSEIRQAVKDGKELSSALSLYPHIFPALYVSLVRAGEDSGTLEEALMRIAEYRYKQEQIISRIRTALTYPLLMAIVGVGTIVFMLTFVMPRLLKIFARLGQDLPLPTKILIGISNFLTQKPVWLVAGILAAGIVFFFQRGIQSKREQLFISYLKLHMPLFGNVFLKAELARFSRTMELLLKSGIQLLRALQGSIPTVDNEIIREELKQGYKAIEQGQSFGATLGRASVFPKFMVNLVSVGEESGKIDEALQELARTYEEETDEAVKIMTNLLEPMMILIMGIMVGFIIVSMLLPVFQLNIMVK